MKRLNSNQGFTLIELLVVITIIAILASIALPTMNSMVAKAQQTKSLSNAKEIAKGCIIFASDNEGLFPSGIYDSGAAVPGAVAAKSYDAFDDLIETGLIKQEAFFWNPKATHACNPAKPNENGNLEAKECAYDYILNLNNTAEGSLPLVLEARTSANKWEKTAGHPWDKKVVIANVDGSGTIYGATTAGEVKVTRNSVAENVADISKAPFPQVTGTFAVTYLEAK